MAKGIIYVMEAICTEGLVKIGKCAIDQFNSRMYTEERNGYCNIPVRRKFALVVEDYDGKEKALHEIFKNCQLGRTELFAADVNRVIKIMQSYDGNQIYPVDETKEQIQKEVEEATEADVIENGIYTYYTKIKKYNKQFGGQMHVEDGILTLLKGTTLSKESGEGYLKKRALLPVDENDALTEDVRISSVSEGASLIAGNSRNGWDCWVNCSGEKISIYRKK